MKKGVTLLTPVYLFYHILKFLEMNIHLYHAGTSLSREDTASRSGL